MTSSHSFPYTKLHPPHTSGDLLTRPRVIERLRHSATTLRLTILSAPAGSGKSTAAAALAAAPDLAVAWLTLDEDDNDLHAFFVVLLGAIERVQPGRTADARLLLERGVEHSSGRQIMGALINDLLERDAASFVLVLEDLHVVTQAAIFQALDYLLEHMPPLMHVVVTTRHDPPLALARLRARGQLAELRMDDLRFTEGELASFCNEILALELAPDDLARMLQRTEGWVAGLRLLTVALSQTALGARRERIQSFAHSERFIFDYLAEEVLSQLQPDRRQFLLEISLLGELTPRICQAVSGRDDAARLLHELRQRNLFLDELGAGDGSTVPPGEQVYRFHALFAQFLQRQLLFEQPGRVRELHRRAAEAQLVPARKIHHFLAAELWDEAAEVIEQVGRDQARQWFVHLPGYWLDALPPTHHERPWMRLLLATTEVQRGQMSAALARLNGLEQCFAAQDDRLGEQCTLMALAQIGLGIGDLELCERAVNTVLSQDLEPMLRAAALIGRIWMAYFRSDWSSITADVHDVLDMAIRANEPSMFQRIAPSLGIQLVFCDVPLGAFERYCDTVLERWGHENVLINTGTNSTLAGIRLLRGQLDRAEKSAEQIEDGLRRLGPLAWVGAYAVMYRVNLAIARGSFADVEQLYLDAQARLGQHDTFRRSEVGLLYFLARAAWLEGRIDGIKQAARLLDAVPLQYKMPYGAVVAPAIAGLLAWSEGRIADAETLLQHAAALQDQRRIWLTLGLVRLDLAALYHATGRDDQALAELGSLLAWVAQREMPGLLRCMGASALPLLQLARQHNVETDFVTSILATWQTDQPAPPALDLGAESLTPREVEVLHLLAEGASNRAIAERLIISERTVKAHVSSILGKLGASSRTAAVALARKQHLI